jgi:cytochrome c-type biogenesis protein CcmH/NrfG
LGTDGVGASEKILKRPASFQRFLAIDPAQDDTWVWLGKAYQKQGDTSKVRDALQHALLLNPESSFARAVAANPEK